MPARPGSKAPSSFFRRLWYRHRRTCLDCGFLGFRDGSEAGVTARSTVALKGAAGWFQHEDAVDCHKRLWNWEDDAPINIIVWETDQLRYGCRGYRRYSPGRSPKDHLALEDEGRSVRLQIVLGFLSFLGAMIGAWIGSKGNGPQG